MHSSKKTMLLPGSSGAAAGEAMFVHARVPVAMLVAAAVFTVTLLAQVTVGDLTFVQTLTSEDHLIENLSVVAFAVGLVCCVVALSRRRYRLTAGLWAVLCLLFIGEETSWFQRLLNYEVPAVEAINSQGEFNLHNLDILHGGRGRTLIGEDGALAMDPARLLSSQSLFRIGFFGYFLIIPLLLFVPAFARLARRIGLPPFDLRMLALLGLLIVATVVLTLMVAPDRRLAVAECREFLFALTIAFYASTMVRSAAERDPRESDNDAVLVARQPMPAEAAIPAGVGAARAQQAQIRTRRAFLPAEGAVASVA
ncbi:MAG: hypothetical protein AAFQ42_04510 [Pseudomonadota bacterium]